MVVKVLEWNINQKHLSNTPAMVIIEIMRQNADIIVLTEFYKTLNYFDVIVTPLQEYGYCVFLDSRPAKNNIRQVLIAIRKNIIANQYIEVQELPDNEANIKDGRFPNFLRVDVVMEDIPITIIGTRIRVWKSAGREERLHRQNQFLELLKQIPEDRRVVILGDMNISNNPEYKRENSEWHYDNIYQKFLSDKKLTLCVPNKGNSPTGSNWKLDHLIISNGITLEEPAQYAERSSWPKRINYPDHAILTATIKM